MARRLPSQPPVLPGFTFVHVLGSGGFADVFLFEQNMPRRQVAVKVLLKEVVNDRVRSMFQSEANLMAQLSSHPAILTVYQAGVSSDGRPYLVMELCSSALADRYRRERIPVAEVLKVGVKIGSAIETAHRAGVLHRDIKPSNILLTAYGHPVLSDFGIAASLSREPDEDSVGLSVPWSAPEVLLDETSGTVASEIWAFAATIYSFLAGRSPFEVPGGDNTSPELIERIAKAKPFPVDRDDVPPALEKLLRSAMSRKPADRPASMLEFVSELQLIEAELGMPQTEIEVAVDEWALAPVGELEERTRVRKAAGVGDRSRRRRRGLPELSDASDAHGTASAAHAEHTQTPRAGRGVPRWVWPSIAGVFVAALAAVVVVTLVIPAVNSLLTSDIPRVAAITTEKHGSTIDFSWANPGIKATDRYSVQVDNDPPSVQSKSQFSYSVTSDDGAQVCVHVSVVRDGRTGEATQQCVDVGTD